MPLRSIYRLREKERFKMINKKRKQKFAKNYSFISKENYDNYKEENDYYKEETKEPTIFSDDINKYKEMVGMDKELIYKNLNSIINILGKDIMTSDKLYKDATLYSKKDYKIVINKKIRKSKKITINHYSKKYSKLKDILISILNEQFNENKNIVISNHIDILKYNPGDFFRKHRDDLTLDEMEKYRNLGYEILTLIICLKSNNIIPESCATVIWKNDNHNEYLKEKSIQQRHLFPTGIEGNGVLFDGSLLHKVNHSVLDTVYKLKVDVYVKNLCVNLFLLNGCNCALCSDDFKIDIIRKKMFYTNNNPRTKHGQEIILDDNIIYNISTFLGKLKRCCCSKKIESLFDFECRCQCDDCLYECREWEEDDYDDESHCNGDY